MQDVVVRPMTPTEFIEYRKHSVDGYAAEHVRAGNWSAEEAVRLAEEQTDELLPDGLDTPGVIFLVAELSGQKIGHVWAGPAPRQRPGWWIYDVEVAAGERRRGCGRLLLDAAEAAIRERGGQTVGLNVFGGNDAARRLYESLGYTVIAAQMSKPLT